MSKTNAPEALCCGRLPPCCPVLQRYSRFSLSRESYQREGHSSLCFCGTPAGEFSQLLVSRSESGLLWHNLGQETKSDWCGGRCRHPAGGAVWVAVQGSAPSAENFQKKKKANRKKNPAKFSSACGRGSDFQGHFS